MLPSVASSQPGTNIGRFFSAAASSQEFLGSIWKTFASFPPAQDLVHELMREIPFAGAVGGDPFREHGLLDAPHGFHLRNAGVRHPVHVAREEPLLVAVRQLPVARDALIIIVRHEIEHVLFKVGSGADNRMDLILPDHLGERDAEFGGRHGPRQRDEHLASRLQVILVGLGGINQRRRIEMPVVARDEPGNRPL